MAEHGLQQGLIVGQAHGVPHGCHALTSASGSGLVMVMTRSGWDVKPNLCSAAGRAARPLYLSARSGIDDRDGSLRSVRLPETKPASSPTETTRKAATVPRDISGRDR